MPTRTPAGRAARARLVARLAVARRGAELLDRKRRALLQAQARARAEAESARAEWAQAAARMDAWTARANVRDGAARLELLRRHARADAAVEISWRNLMGARIPVLAELSLPQSPPLSGLGGSAAVVVAAGACCEAARAAARCAAAERSERELARELARATRRLRAVEERLIPSHEDALARLDLALDEDQREQAGRVRWIVRRRVPTR